MKTHKTMLHKTMLLPALAVLASAISAQLANAQLANAQPAAVPNDCTYGPVTVICHPATTNYWTGCCSDMSSPICGVYPWTLWSSATPLMDQTSEGRIITCGGGTTAKSMGDKFDGACAWSSWGCTCVGPYGPTPMTGPYSINNCIGNCGGG
jgi:hypothetical protein